MNIFASILCVIMLTLGTAISALSVKDGGYICCPPDTISATMFTQAETFASSGVQHTFARYDFNADYINKQISIKGVADNKTVHYIIHTDVTYDINDELKTCVLSHSIPYTPKQCLTDKMTSVGPVNYGPLKTTGYKLDAGDYHSFVTMTDQCISVNWMQTTSSPTGTTITSNVYSDIKTTVDKSAFVIPSFCPKP